ncbi:SH3 domain-containing protein 19 [Cyprinodon tularosa]|uniref:SH3 domain-containing protein 19 n=1 Tax=Cyprinodon tularosa TaxID=77115 RepID=UPI0018E20762|nr:SH3 domain-containing protein 19 [Cyprinodon tularosa]
MALKDAPLFFSLDFTARAKPCHLPCSQGPLSSLRAAFKRTRSNSQNDSRTERRRPNITIVSVEPLARNTWFTGGPVVFPPQADWCAGIQAVSQPPPSYDQVIKEKTQRDHQAKPTAAPRQSICRSTSGAHSDPVRNNTDSPCSATCSHAEGIPTAKKPNKPPRSSLTKASNAKGGIKIARKTPEPTSTRGSNWDCDPDLRGFENTASEHKSVIVHWNIPTNRQSDSSVSVTPAASNLESRPVARPRTKLHQKTIIEEERQSITLGENCDTPQSHSQEVPTTEYLEELLRVSEGNTFGDSRYFIDQSFEELLDEDADGAMSTNNNNRKLSARIQAFESQSGTGEENGSQPGTLDLPPRRASYKPPVASKPSVAVKPPRTNGPSQNMAASQNQEPTTRPKPPTKPVGHSVRQELEALHSNGGLPNQSRPFGLTRSNSIHEEERVTSPPLPPVKPFKEPLKPNLNLNNHNVYAQNENMFTPSRKAPLIPQFSLDSSGSSAKRQGSARRPTTIRVPGKGAADNYQDGGAPPVPVKNPIGSMNSSMNYKQSLTPSKSFQNTFSTGPEPPLPPRKPSMKKAIPPCPSPAKAGPGRPPPPNLQACGRSQSAPQQPSPKLKSQKPTKKGLVLPPRPSPGHRLYNNYILPLPHGIASADFDGSNTGELTLQKNEVLMLLEKINPKEFECQIGETTGRVHKSRMKIITPLDSDSSYPQDGGASASGGGSDRLKVKALHDFDPEGPRELSLRAGDVVTEVEQVDSEWYLGTCNGSTGYFPINYVTILSQSPKPLPKKKAKTQPASVSGPRCVARFDFEGEHSDELSFLEGDVIQLEEYVGQDWARGQIGVNVGIFPLTFVEIIEDLPPPPSQQQAARIALPGLTDPSPFEQPEAAKPVQDERSSVEWAVALYDHPAKTPDELSFRKDDCILITKHLNEDWCSGRLNGREGMFPRAFIEFSSGDHQDDSPQYGAASCVRGKALYSFTSDCEEELSLQVGDVITNLESVDDEWFLGDLRGKRALVPKNYVQVID